MALLLLLLACGAREVAPYLRPSATAEAPAPQAAPITDLSSGLAAAIGRDPLARRPDPGSPGQWSALDGGAPLEAWATAARQSRSCGEDLLALEPGARGTPVVALVRGASLACLETQLLVNDALDPLTAHQLFQWFGPLRNDDRPLPSDAREPLAWLGPLDPADARRVLLLNAERRVLLGWLDGPTIPLEPVGRLLEPPLYDRLLAEPAGALIDARADRRSDPERGLAGRALLERATTLALEEVAADRDNEQAAWKERRTALQAELALRPDQNPIRHLLERARETLTADARSDASTGHALVALSAARLHGPCEPGACRDLDRTSTLARAETWAPEVAPMARAWQVWALKNVTDAFEVSLARPSFTALMPDLLDALAGTGEARFPTLLLRRGLPTPQLFLDLSRGAGGPDQIDGPGMLANLKTRLARCADHALALEQLPEHGATLQRIRARAGP